MRILITQHRLERRGGTEMYVFDLATSLLERGHRVTVYSTQLGQMGREFRRATIPLINNLELISVAPDIIHGHHGMETLSALMQFPNVPAVYIQHDWEWIVDKPPVMDRIYRYLAVDETCLDRLVSLEGVPNDRAGILQNAVNLKRFRQRAQLPDRPHSALVFSNYMNPTSVAPIRQACEQLRIGVSVIGDEGGSPSQDPQDELGQYDLVFAKGRCAREALAVGAAVVVCDVAGCGQMVTFDQLQPMSRMNFGRRLLQYPMDVDHLVAEIKKYDAADARNVSNYVRLNFGLHQWVDNLQREYEQAIEANLQSGPPNQIDEYRQVSKYLRSWMSGWAASRQMETNVTPAKKRLVA